MFKCSLALSTIKENFTLLQDIEVKKIQRKINKFEKENKEIRKKNNSF